MNLMSIARPYAKAAFSCAVDTNAIQQWHEVLNVAAEVIQQTAVKQLFLDPNISEVTASCLFIELLELNNETLKHFFMLLVDYHRMPLLPYIFREFVQLKEFYEQSLKVSVISTMPLSQEQQQQIKQALARRYKKEIILTVKIDESILGGAIIRIEDLVIDGSIQGRLTKLCEYLKGEKL